MDRRTAGAGLAAAATLAWLHPALAQNAAPPYIQAEPAETEKAFGPDMTARIFSDEFSDVRRAWIQRSTTGIPNLTCASEPAVALISIDSARAADGGHEWIERYLVDCSGEHVRRALFMLAKSSKLDVIPMAPGKTIAGAVLQIDAQKQVDTAAALEAAGTCATFVSADTEVLEKPENGGPWKERWSVAACGELISIDVTFTPSSAGGTDISAHVTDDTD